MSSSSAESSQQVPPSAAPAQEPAGPAASEGQPAADPSQKRKRSDGYTSTRSDKAKAYKIDQAFREVFGPLGLEEVANKEKIGKTKTRNHVNPLASKFQTPISPPSWAEIYKDVSRPLWIDIGCAQGRFGIQMAGHPKWKSHNHLGLEIRAPHVERANAWAKGKGLDNLHYIACNANTSLKVILSTYPGPVSHVAVQFPDPQFKKKHHKRRVVNSGLMDVLAEGLKEGAHVFFQSDVEEAAAQMRDRADLCEYFKREGEYTARDEMFDAAACADGSDDSLWTNDGKRAKFSEESDKQPADYGDWLMGPNPIGVMTEREVQNTTLEEPVHRAMFVRTAQPVTKAQQVPSEESVDASAEDSARST
eukprot:CAMPEP_0202076886 /NCGR_PEP_ID=MMETSP0964-20121228/5060_1 /ASSEMBLY_ACC=CAM_ASM_000500 /TAXON_ID=4773 /ORGANISM="Schizochytrium aggregatum, Strain ATCC28209" /LENGTH=362 /DNA_ID=CAMNT_0048644139 /DNA_START=58 /DNA_END=1146 /DNA_ORIENTATION=+